MAGYIEHCKYTEKLYGCDGGEIHSWIDAPQKKLGSKHRILRHSSFQDLPDNIRSKYGEKLSYLIFLSHIDLDNADNVEDCIAKAVPSKYYDSSWVKYNQPIKQVNYVRRKYSPYWSFQKVKKAEPTKENKIITKSNELTLNYENIDNTQINNKQNKSIMERFFNYINKKLGFFKN